MTAGVHVLSCRLTSAPLWLGIYLFLWWVLLAIFGLFLLHWRYELPCQDKLPEFHSTPILGCIKILWLVSHPLGLRLDKDLCGWNSVTIVSPSPPVGGTPCRLPTSARLLSLKFFRSTYNLTTLKSVS